MKEYEIKASNLFYIPYFNVIGGTEQFIYEIAKKYNKYDIAVLYKDGDVKQLSRLRSYIPCYKYDGQSIKCKRLYCNYSIDIIDKIDADEYVQIIHAMYKTNKITPILNDKITRYIAVSEIARDEFKELTGIECEVVRNPLTFEDDDKKDVLILISATRLTAEKGKSRMELLIKKLDEAKVKWLWLIFTNDTKAINNKNIVYLPPRLDVRPYLQIAKGKGFGVQLSDCEGDCYFTRECEAIGLPLLITPLPSFKEQGLVEGKNCHYIPFDVNIDINTIINDIPTYEPYIKKDEWSNVLIKDKSKYLIGGKTMKVEVKCIQQFFDLKANCDRVKEETWICDKERGDLLVELGLVEILRAIKETKKEKATPKTKKEKATQ